MPSFTEIAYGLYGAWRLAHLDRSAMSLFDRTVSGFWKSFFAAVLVAPAYLILRVLDVDQSGIAAGPLHSFIVLALGYIVSWLAFPVVMHPICHMIDRPEYFISFIVANNWAKVLQIYAILLIVAIHETGLLPAAIGTLLVFLTNVLIFAFEWFIARTALNIGGMAAAGLVILGGVLNYAIYAWTLAMVS